jgi:hypothetical protein
MDKIKKGPTKYQQQLKMGGNSRGGRDMSNGGHKSFAENSERAKQKLLGDQIDEIFGFSLLTEVIYDYYMLEFDMCV